MFEFFPEQWRPELEVLNTIPSIKLDTIVIENKSGCAILFFDGMAILFDLFTIPSERNKGLARRVVEKASQKYQFVFARYRNDEKNTAKLFSNAGFRFVSNKNNYTIVTK